MRLAHRIAIMHPMRKPSRLRRAYERGRYDERQKLIVQLEAECMRLQASIDEMTAENNPVWTAVIARNRQYIAAHQDTIFALRLKDSPLAKAAARASRVAAAVRAVVDRLVEKSDTKP